MKKNQKEALVWLLGAIGFLILLGGIFTHLYEFTYGLIVAIIIWTMAGFVRRYYGIKERK